MKYFNLITAFFLFSISGAICQESLLDRDYGNNGVASSNYVGIPYFIFHFSMDSDQNLYFSGTYDRITAGTAENGLHLRRFDKNGQMDESFFFDTNFNQDTSKVMFENSNFFWQQDNFVVAYENRNEAEDTIKRTKLYELNGDLKCSFETLPSINFGSSFSNQLALINNEETITNLHLGTTSRLFKDGTPDLSFGEDGSNKIVDFETTNDSLYSAFYDFITKTTEDELFYLHFSEQNSIVAKLNTDGMLDKSYGDNGLVKLKDKQVLQVLSSNNGSYKVIHNTVDTLNPSSDFYMMKLDANGNQEFAISLNHYQAEFDTTAIFGGKYLEGPQGYGVYFTSVTEYNEEDSLSKYHYYMHRHLPTGALDTSFGDLGSLRMPSLPGSLTYWQLIDEEFNVYLIGFDKLSLSDFDNKIFVTKLKASAVWPNISNSNTSAGNFKMYPNPAHHQVWMEYQGNFLDKATLLLYDIHGRPLLTKTVSEVSGGDEVLILNEQLSPGTYFLRVKDSQWRNLFTEKLITVN